MDLSQLLRALGLQQAYQSYQQNIGQPFANVAGPFGRGLLGLERPEYGQEQAYRTGQALSNMPGTGAPAGLLKASAQVPDLIALLGSLGAASKAVPIYHGTTPKAARAIEKSGFDISKSADGTIWFTNNPEIGEVAATGKGAVVKRMLDENNLKLGGWDEMDRFSIDELIQQGYDGLKLPDQGGQVTYQIFNPEKLSIK